MGGMAAPDLADPDLAAVEWNLDPLLDGAGDGGGSTPCSTRRSAPRRRVRRRPRRAGGRARRARARRRHDRARRAAGPGRPRGLLRRRCASPRPPPTPSAAPCCRRCRSAARSSRRGCCSSSSSGRRSRTSSADAPAGRRRARLRPPPPAQRAALPPAPPLGARGEDPRREVAHQQRAPGRACSRSRRPRSRSSWTGRTSPVALEVALSRLFSPERDVRRHAAERVTAALAAGPARARLRAQHAAGRQDGRRPAAPLPALARQPQPRQRGVGRVGGRARRRGPRPLRAAAPLVPAQGAAARARPPRRLRPHGRRHRRRRRRSRGPRRATSCSTPTPSFSPELAATARAFFDGDYIDAPVRPGKRGGAFCAYTVPSAHPYVLLNYTARRRDVLTLAHELGHGVHASLARPAGRLPLRHAADHGRDGERVRRDDRLRPAARAGADAGVAPVPAGREHRGLDRHGVPPGRHEPLRAPRPHRRGARRASWRSTASTRSGRSRRRSCWATRWR